MCLTFQRSSIIDRGFPHHWSIQALSLVLHKWSLRRDMLIQSPVRLLCLCLLVGSITLANRSQQLHVRRRQTRVIILEQIVQIAASLALSIFSCYSATFEYRSPAHSGHCLVNRLWNPKQVCIPARAVVTWDLVRRSRLLCCASIISGHHWLFTFHWFKRASVFGHWPQCFQFCMYSSLETTLFLSRVTHKLLSFFGYTEDEGSKSHVVAW